MIKKKIISSAVIRRLPRYYQFLGELLEHDITKISSTELSVKMDLTASQIRQDLNNFGCFGQQGYGYNVAALRNEIKKIIGLDQNYKMVLVGVGKIGRALLSYDNFQNYTFAALFDKDKDVIGEEINGLKVTDAENLEDYLNENQIDIVVLTLPKNETLKVAEKIAKTNTLGIWNFSNCDLHSIKNIKIEDVNLTDSLMTLTYMIKKKS